MDKYIQKHTDAQYVPIQIYQNIFPGAFYTQKIQMWRAPEFTSLIQSHIIAILLMQ
jgi:hypothetical protein